MSRKEFVEAEDADVTVICPLCLRPIPSDVQQSLHHLIPRAKGGAKGPTVLLHQICHEAIHSALKETELARRFNTIEALRSEPRLAAFVEWVARRPPGFMSQVPGGTSKRR